MGGRLAHARRQLGQAIVTELSCARRAALEVLLELEESGAYARDALDASPAVAELSQRDRGLATRLVLGVVATYGCLDELIDAYCDKPGRMNARIRAALRIAVFELIYLGTEPHVAVSQGVELVRSRAKSAAGFANAVLRRVVRDRQRYRFAEDIDDAADRRIASSARSAGLPFWLTEEIERSLGTDRARDLFPSELEPAPVAVQVNPRDAGAAEEAAALVAAESACSAPLPGCVAPISGAALVATDLLRRAGVAVCDVHAQLIATAAVCPGASLEVGAGRGTKSFVMAAQAARFGIERTAVALELSKKRCRVNRRRLERARLIEGVRVLAGDGCDLDCALFDLDQKAGERMRFDGVLVDAPCTGTGTMRRHPEIPWRLAPDDVDRAMPALQLALLTAAAARVKPGGQLLYATCSVLRQENEAVVDAFLESSGGARFSVQPLSEAPVFARQELADARRLIARHEDRRGMFQSVPCANGFDGHFCARLIC